jgi:peptidoglycan/LPS O-acetylase OafA/YrhL
MNGEIRTLTGLRGFAAVWVVLFHVQHAQHVTAFDLGAFIGRGYLAVDAFFVLSGLILAHVYGTAFDQGWSWSRYRQFLWARFARVYPMHLVMLLAFFALVAVAALVGRTLNDQGAYTLRGALESLFLLHGLGVSERTVWNYPSWSISAEAFAYAVLFWPAMTLMRRLPGGVVMGIIAVLWAGVLAFAWGRPHQSLDLTYDFGVLRIVPEFLAGVWLHRVLARHPVTDLASSLCVLASLGGLLLISQLPLWAEAGVLPCLCLLLAGLYGGSRSVQAVFGNRASVWLGRVSYSMYLVHFFVMLVAGQLLSMAGVDTLPPVLQLGWMSVLLLLAIAGGAVGYYGIEEPARRWLRRCSAPVNTTDQSAGAGVPVQNTKIASVR